MSVTVVQAGEFSASRQYDAIGDVCFREDIPDGARILVTGSAVFEGKIGADVHIYTTGACHIKQSVAAETKICAASIMAHKVGAQCSLKSTDGDVSIYSAGKDLKVQSAAGFKALGPIDSYAVIAARGAAHVETLGVRGQIRAASIVANGMVGSESWLESTRGAVCIRNCDSDVHVQSAGRLVAKGEVGAHAHFVAAKSAYFAKKLGARSKVSAASVRAHVIDREVTLTSTHGDIEIAAAEPLLVVHAAGGFRAKRAVMGGAEIVAKNAAIFKETLGSHLTVEAANIVAEHVGHGCVLKSTVGDVMIGFAQDKLTVRAAGAFVVRDSVGAEADIQQHMDLRAPAKRKWAETTAAAGKRAKANGTGFGWGLAQ